MTRFRWAVVTVIAFAIAVTMPLWRACKPTRLETGGVVVQSPLPRSSQGTAPPKQHANEQVVLPAKKKLRDQRKPTRHAPEKPPQHVRHGTPEMKPPGRESPPHGPMQFIGPGADVTYGSIVVAIETPSSDGRPGSEASFLSTDTVSLTVADNCAWWTIVGATGGARRTDFARKFEVVAMPPVAPKGRSAPLTMTIFAVGATGSTVVTLKQDDIDRIRQQYADMHKDRTPGREEFISTADMPGFREIQSHDREPWAIFTAGPKLAAWRNRYASLAVNRAYSTPRHNAAVGGARNSQHIYGAAIDAASTRADWYSKRNVVRDLGACIEPADISKFNHVHGDWRKGCPEKWRAKARESADGTVTESSSFLPSAGHASTLLSLMLPLRNVRTNATFGSGSGSSHGTPSRRAAVTIGAGVAAVLLAHQIHERWRPSAPCASGTCAPLSFHDWPLRSEVLPQLDANDGLPETQRFLIDSLVTENAYLRWRRTQTLPDLCEDYGDYYIALALAVSELDDERAIAALTGAMDVAPAVATTLASYGDPAVQPVLAMLREPFAQDGAAYTLGRFVEGRRAHGIAISRWNLRRIRRALVRLARAAGEIAVRGTAVRGLGEFDPDWRLRALMDTLADEPGLRAHVDAAREAWASRAAAP